MGERRNTVKAFVEQCLKKGMSRDEIYRLAETDRPHLHITWNYIGQVERAFRRALTAASGGRDACP